jgi:hypothetical protein
LRACPPDSDTALVITETWETRKGGSEKGEQRNTNLGWGDDDETARIEDNEFHLIPKFS